MCVSNMRVHKTSNKKQQEQKRAGLQLNYGSRRLQTVLFIMDTGECV